MCFALSAANLVELLLWGLRATSHTRLKARDHCILRSLIGRKARDSTSSLHIRGDGLRVQRNYHG